MTEEKKKKLLGEKMAMLSYLENGDKESAKALRTNCIRFNVVAIPGSILIAFVVLAIPFGLLDKDFTIASAFRIAFVLAGIPAILSMLVTLIFPALDDESLYIGIAWIILVGIMLQWTGLIEALIISFLIMTVFCMWYKNHSKQDKIEKVQHTIYSLKAKL